MVEEDPAEEYFRTLERISDPNDAQMRIIIANARNDYRQRSRYTPEYWEQREAYLRSKVVPTPKKRPKGAIRKWIDLVIQNLLRDIRK